MRPKLRQLVISCSQVPDLSGQQIVLTTCVPISSLKAGRLTASLV